MTHQSTELEEVLHRSYGYALSLVQDDALAQDLVQEACLKISRKGGPWHIGYFITTIRNCYIDYYRRESKIEFYQVDELNLVGWHDIPDTSFDPELEYALNQLSSEERELLFLNVSENYSASEIATLTKKPRGTVLSMIYRTKQKLRRLLVLEKVRIDREGI